MTTDAEYRALAERLAEGVFGSDEAKTDDVLNAYMRQASSAILALLDLKDWNKHKRTLAESRLGKAVDLLQRTINGPVSADTHEKEWALFDETMAFLSDLEKSE